MQGIFAYNPEINYVAREYGVAAVLLFLFMVLISLVSVLNLLYFYISTFRSMCAVPNMAVFCSSLTSWFIIIIIIICFPYCFFFFFLLFLFIILALILHCGIYLVAVGIPQSI